MSISIITGTSDIDTDKWYDFLENHPHDNVFQSPYFYDVYKDSPDHKPCLFIAKKGTDITGVLLSYTEKHIKGLFSKFSSRAIIWGGPFVKDNNKEIIKQLLISHDNYFKNKVVYTQIRNIYSTSEVKDVFHSLNYSLIDHINFIIDLRKSRKNLWENISPKGRNKIRAASNEKCKFEVLQKNESIDNCYYILNSVYKRVKLPLADKEYFRNLLKCNDNHVNLKIFTAVFEDQIIACRLALLFKNCIYDYYAGSLKSYDKLHPNDFLMWEIIKWGQDNGYKYFDFGGAGKPKTFYGVRNFKQKFGGEKVNYGRYIKINSRFQYMVAKTGFHIWQKFN